MGKRFDRVRMNVSSTGTGPATLGPAVSAAFQTLDQAGAIDQDLVDGYVFEDGNGWEYGYGVYTAGGTTLTRNVIGSSNGNNPINLSGAAIFFCDAQSRNFFDWDDQVQRHRRLASFANAFTLT